MTTTYSSPYKVGGVTATITTSSGGQPTSSVGKTYVPVTLTGNVTTSGPSATLTIGGGSSNVPASKTVTETITFGTRKPTITETVTIDKPTTTVTTQPATRTQTIIVSSSESDGGVKAVAAKLLETYDKKNTGVIDNSQIGVLLQDVYKILGESYFAKPDDVEGLARVLDVNKDGKVTADDIEALCQKYLGGPKKIQPVFRKGEQEKRSGLPEDDEKPPEVEFARQIFDARAIFAKYDEDKSGFLEEHEIPFVLQETYNKIGIKKTINPDQVKSYIHTLDLNKDGKVDLDEFIKVLVSNLIKDKERFKPTGVSYSAGGYQKPVIKTELEKAREIFDRHDTDKSGFLEPNELVAVLKEMLSSINIRREITQNDVRAYLKSFDKNFDSKISFEEFSRLVDIAKKQ